MRLDEKITSVAFGRPKIESDKNVPRIRVCVLGLPSVGKTGTHIVHVFFDDNFVVFLGESIAFLELLLLELLVIS